MNRSLKPYLFIPLLMSSLAQAQVLDSQVSIVKLTGRPGVDSGAIQIILPEGTTITGASCSVSDGSTGNYNNRTFFFSGGTNETSMSMLQNYVTMALSAQAQSGTLRFIFDPAGCVSGYGVTITAMALSL